MQFSLLGLKIGRTNEQIAADNQLKGISAQIKANAEELWKIVQDVAPGLDQPLIFIPESGVHNGGWVQRKFIVAHENESEDKQSFSHAIYAWSHTDAHTRVRVIELQTEIESKDFSFNVSIYNTTDTSSPVTYYVGSWSLGFKGEKVSSDKLTRDQVFRVKGLGGIISSIVKQVALWHAEGEVQEAAEFGPESRAVLEAHTQE